MAIKWENVPRELKRLACQGASIPWKIARLPITLSEIPRKRREKKLGRRIHAEAMILGEQLTGDELFTRWRLEKTFEEAYFREPRDFADKVPGRLVGVRYAHIDLFLERVLPRLTMPTVVILSDHPTHSCDRSVWNVRNFLDHPMIERCFAENWNDGAHPKLTLLPTGFASRMHLGLQPLLSEWGDSTERFLWHMHRRLLPPSERPLRVMSTAHLMEWHKPKSGRSNERRAMYEALKERPYVDFWPKRQGLIPSWEQHDAYAFELAPEGNGIDTHRFYEAIMLRTIPIVRENPITSVYRQFPCVVVKEWEEVTLDNLKRWHAELAGSYNEVPPACRLKYWTDKIKAVL